MQNQEQEWTLEAWQQHIDALTERSSVINDLLRGRSYVSSEELEIIYSNQTKVEKDAGVASIRHARMEKMERRKKAAKRAAKVLRFPVKHVPFEALISHTDDIYVRGLGIRLDS